MRDRLNAVWATCKISPIKDELIGTAAGALAVAIPMAAGHGLFEFSLGSLVGGFAAAEVAPHLTRKPEDLHSSTAFGIIPLPKTAVGFVVEAFRTGKVPEELTRFQY